MLLVGPASDGTVVRERYSQVSADVRGHLDPRRHAGRRAPQRTFFSLIGAVHNDQESFWRPGGTASPQLERVAELGLQAQLRALMGRSPHVHAVLEKDPGRGGTARTTIEFETTRDDPLVTLVTMIAPSPDWFVAFPGCRCSTARGGG